MSAAAARAVHVPVSRSTRVMLRGKVRPILFDGSIDPAGKIHVLTWDFVLDRDRPIAADMTDGEAADVLAQIEGGRAR